MAEGEAGSAGLVPAARSFYECVSSIVTHCVVALFVPPIVAGLTQRYLLWAYRFFLYYYSIWYDIIKQI